jgi:hypothetical protein
LDFGLGGPVEVQKGYIPSCLLNDDLSMKIFGAAVWIGRAGGKEKCNIYVLCDAVVFGIENLSLLVPPCGLVWPVRRERLIFGDAVVFGTEILAGKNPERRCVSPCCFF